MELITESEFRRIVKKFRPDIDASMDYEHAEQSMAELGVTPQQFRALRLKNARLNYHVAVVVCVLVLLVMLVLNIYNAHLVAVGWDTTSPSEFHTATFILILTVMMDFACGSAAINNSLEAQQTLVRTQAEALERSVPTHQHGR